MFTVAVGRHWLASSILFCLAVPCACDGQAAFPALNLDLHWETISRLWHRLIWLPAADDAADDEADDVAHHAVDDAAHDAAHEAADDADDACSRIISCIFLSLIILQFKQFHHSSISPFITISSFIIPYSSLQKQFEFRVGINTVDAISCFMNFMYDNLNDKQNFLRIFVDLKKALTLWTT